MKKFNIVLISLGLLFGFAGISSQPNISAKASNAVTTTSPYSVTRFSSATKKVAYYSDPKSSGVMWNFDHTKILHNLKSYPNTTWFVKNSITLQKGSSKVVYYEVYNPSQSVDGFVWRGYLKKGLNPSYKGKKMLAVSDYSELQASKFFGDNLKALSQLPADQFNYLVQSEVKSKNDSVNKIDSKLTNAAKLMVTTKVSEAKALSTAKAATTGVKKYTAFRGSASVNPQAFWLTQQNTDALAFYATLIHQTLAAVNMSGKSQKYGFYVSPNLKDNYHPNVVLLVSQN